MNFYAVSRYMFGRQFPAHSLLRPAQRVSACRHIHPVETDSQRSGIAGIDDDPRTALGHCLSAAVRLGAIAGMVVITMMPGVPFACTGIRFARFNRGLTVASGVDQCGLRAVHHLPDWLRGRAVHLASLLNAPLKPVREGKATLHSWGMEFAGGAG